MSLKFISYSYYRKCSLWGTVHSINKVIRVKKSSQQNDCLFDRNFFL